MPRAWIDRGAAFVIAVLAATFLAVRVVPDVALKPIHQDEALAGLIAARPLPEVLDVVLRDRGGAPLHFVLAHVALWLDPSPAALRWLSVILALATVLVCFDLGRRLVGPLAGAVSASVVAGSTMFAVYGSFGRMYALFALASALAADLFVRALHERTLSASLAAAGAALLLPASHPYGLLVVGVEAVVALAVWRGRPLRRGLPVVAVGLLAFPFAVASMRLADRYDARIGERTVLGPDLAYRYLGRVLAGAAGGAGLTLALMTLLAVAGFALLLVRERAFALFTGVAIVTPIVFLMVVGGGGGRDQLAVRHLIFVVPYWAAAIGVAVGAVAARGGPVFGPAIAAVVSVAALVSPGGGLVDPRTLPSGQSERLAGPAAWVETHVGRGDVLFPYSPVFLRALPTTRVPAIVGRGDPDTVLRGLERAELPANAVVVAVHLDHVRLEPGVSPSRGVSMHRFRSWLLLRVPGPFATRGEVLEGLALALADAVRATSGDSVLAAQGYASVCGALRTLGEACPTLE